MRYHKLKAGECPGTYLVTEPVTEQDLLRIANQIARKRLAKGSAITSTTEAAERLLPTGSGQTGLATQLRGHHRGAQSPQW